MLSVKMKAAHHCVHGLCDVTWVIHRVEFYGDGFLHVELSRFFFSHITWNTTFFSTVRILRKSIFFC